MKIKQTILVFALFIGFSGIFISQPVFAGTCGGVETSLLNCDQEGLNKIATCADGPYDPYEGIDPTKTPYNYLQAYEHGYGMCKDGTKPVITVVNGGSDVTKTGIWGLLLMIINIMTAGIGIVAVGGIIYGSILYASAGGGPENIKKAKTIITDIVIGLVAYAFMFAFLNFIIPGGMFAL